MDIFWVITKTGLVLGVISMHFWGLFFESGYRMFCCCCFFCFFFFFFFFGGGGGGAKISSIFGMPDNPDIFGGKQ